MKVQTPALNRTPGHGAGVVAAGCNRRCGADAGSGHRHEAVTATAIAKLAVGVETPTLHYATVEEGT
jgi:hypothetical protein